MATKGIKKVTVDELARMTQDGFVNIEKVIKSEIRGEIRTAFSDHTRVMLDEFRRLNADVTDIKGTLRSSIVISGEHEQRIGDLESRMLPVEKKVGIVRIRR